MVKIISSLALIIFTTLVLFGQNRFKDCSDAFPVCHFGTYYFSDVSGPGSFDDLNKNLCRNISLIETNSIWFKFKFKTDGEMIFSITPFNHDDDIDFILYRADDFMCDSKEDIRCMASGESIGYYDEMEFNCLGVTGLDYRSNDYVELHGCRYPDDNFLKFLTAKSGETFLLFVNNYNSGEGFSIAFDGSGELELISDCKEEKNHQSLQLLDISPVPSKNTLNISLFTATHEPFTIEILTLSGQSVYQMKHFSENKYLTIPIDISSFTAGSYFVRIKNNTSVLLEKFLKI